MATSMTLDSALEDVEARFLYNRPESELSRSDRLHFQIEQAWWFYEDFKANNNPHLPSFPKLQQFAKKIFSQCRLLSSRAEMYEELFADISVYKSMIPVYGVIMLSPDMTKMVLVCNYKDNSWSFPMGKVNQNEGTLARAVREALEETGFDSTAHCREGDSVVNVEETKIFKLYIATNVPETTVFEMQTRKEISKISFFPIDNLPSTSFGVHPFVNRLKRWINLKQKSEGGKPRSGASESNANPGQQSASAENLNTLLQDKIKIVSPGPAPAPATSPPKDSPAPAPVREQLQKALRSDILKKFERCLSSCFSCKAPIQRGSSQENGSKPVYFNCACLLSYCDTCARYQVGSTSGIVSHGKARLCAKCPKCNVGVSFADVEEEAVKRTEEDVQECMNHFDPKRRSPRNQTQSISDNNSKPKQYFGDFFKLLGKPNNGTGFQFEGLVDAWEKKHEQLGNSPWKSREVCYLMLARCWARIKEGEPTVFTVTDTDQDFPLGPLENVKFHANKTIQNILHSIASNRDHLIAYGFARNGEPGPENPMKVASLVAKELQCMNCLDTSCYENAHPKMFSCNCEQNCFCHDCTVNYILTNGQKLLSALDEGCVMCGHCRNRDSNENSLLPVILDKNRKKVNDMIQDLLEQNEHYSKLNIRQANQKSNTKKFAAFCKIIVDSGFASFAANVFVSTQKEDDPDLLQNIQVDDYEEFRLLAARLIFMQKNGENMTREQSLESSKLPFGPLEHLEITRNTILSMMILCSLEDPWSCVWIEDFPWKTHSKPAWKSYSALNNSLAPEDRPRKEIKNPAANMADGEWKKYVRGQAPFYDEEVVNQRLNIDDFQHVEEGSDFNFRHISNFSITTASKQAKLVKLESMRESDDFYYLCGELVSKYDGQGSNKHRRIDIRVKFNSWHMYSGRYNFETRRNETKGFRGVVISSSNTTKEGNKILYLLQDANKKYAEHYNPMREINTLYQTIFDRAVHHEEQDGLGQVVEWGPKSQLKLSPPAARDLLFEDQKRWIKIMESGKHCILRSLQESMVFSDDSPLLQSLQSLPLSSASTSTSASAISSTSNSTSKAPRKRRVINDDNLEEDDDDHDDEDDDDDDDDGMNVQQPHQQLKQNRPQENVQVQDLTLRNPPSMSQSGAVASSNRIRKIHAQDEDEIFYPDPAQVPVQIPLGRGVRAFIDEFELQEEGNADVGYFEIQRNRQLEEERQMKLDETARVLAEFESNPDLMQAQMDAEIEAEVQAYHSSASGAVERTEKYKSGNEGVAGYYGPRTVETQFYTGRRTSRTVAVLNIGDLELWNENERGIPLNPCQPVDKLQVTSPAPAPEVVHAPLLRVCHPRFQHLNIDQGIEYGIYIVEMPKRLIVESDFLNSLPADVALGNATLKLCVYPPDRTFHPRELVNGKWPMTNEDAPVANFRVSSVRQQLMYLQSQFRIQGLHINITKYFGRSQGTPVSKKNTLAFLNINPDTTNLSKCNNLILLCPLKAQTPNLQEPAFQHITRATQPLTKQNLVLAVQSTSSLITPTVAKPTDPVEIKIEATTSSTAVTSPDTATDLQRMLESEVAAPTAIMQVDGMEIEVSDYRQVEMSYVIDRGPLASGNAKVVTLDGMMPSAKMKEDRPSSNPEPKPFEKKIKRRVFTKKKLRKLARKGITTAEQLEAYDSDDDDDDGDEYFDELVDAHPELLVIDNAQIKRRNVLLDEQKPLIAKRNALLEENIEIDTKLQQYVVDPRLEAGWQKTKANNSKRVEELTATIAALDKRITEVMQAKEEKIHLQLPASAPTHVDNQSVRKEQEAQLQRGRDYQAQMVQREQDSHPRDDRAWGFAGGGGARDRRNRGRDSRDRDRRSRSRDRGRGWDETWRGRDERWRGGDERWRGGDERWRDRDERGRGSNEGGREWAHRDSYDSRSRDGSGFNPEHRPHVKTEPVSSISPQSQFGPAALKAVKPPAKQGKKDKKRKRNDSDDEDDDDDDDDEDLGGPTKRIG